MGETFHKIKLDDMQREYLHGHATRELREVAEGLDGMMLRTPIPFGELRDEVAPIRSVAELLDVIGWEQDSHQATILEPDNPVCPVGKVQALVRLWRKNHDAPALTKAKQQLEIAELHAVTTSKGAEPPFEPAELVKARIEVAETHRVLAIAESLLLSMSGLDGASPEGVTAKALH